MSTRERVVHQIPVFLGVASGINPDIIGPTKSKLAYNFYTQNGILRKVQGLSLYIQTAFGSAALKWMDSYQKRLMWQSGANLMIETAEGTQVETLLSNAFDVDKLFSDKWRDKIYFGNGKQLKYYDGANLNDLGILPPGNGLTPRRDLPASVFAFNGLGTLLADGTYKYTFTYFDSLTQTESLPCGALVAEDGLFNDSEYSGNIQTPNYLGWISFSKTTASQSIIILLSPPIVELFFANRPSRVTDLRIYRNFNGGDYRLVTTVPFASLMSGIYFYGDVTAQTALGPVLLTDNKIPPPRRDAVINSGGPQTTVGPKFLRFWRDSLFMFGGNYPAFTVTDTLKGITNQNFASQSILYASDTFLPEYVRFDWEIGSGDGQDPGGLAVVNDILCVFKQRSIYTLVGTSLNNFIAKIQDSVHGCIAPGSIQETPLGAFFLSDAGVGVFRGVGEAEIISNEILDEILAINRNALDGVCSSYDKTNEIYELFVPQGTDTSNTRVLRYSIKDKAWTTGRRRREISAAAYVPRSNKQARIMLGTASGSSIFDATDRKNVSDNGGRITAIWRSSVFDFGNREYHKKVVWLYIKAACAVNWIVDIAVYADDAQGPVYEATNIDSESDLPEYSASLTDPDGAVYNTDRYAAAQTIKKLKIPVSGIGRTFYVEITEKSNSSIRHSFDLLSVEVEGVELGR